MNSSLATFNWDGLDPHSESWPLHITTFRNVNLKNAFTSINFPLFKLLQMNSVVHLSLERCSLNFLELHVMLTIVGTSLKSLWLHDVEITGNKDAVMHIIVMPQLQFLSLRCEFFYDFDYIVSCICSTNLQRIYYTDHRRIQHESSDGLVDFIANQTQLDEIYLECSGAIVLKLANHRSIKFRVNRLTLEFNGNVDPQRMPDDVLQFIETQRLSLNKLTLVQLVINDDQMEHLMSLDLQRLVLNACDFMLDRWCEFVNWTITEIEFVDMHSATDQRIEIGLCNLLMCCRATQKLRLRNVARTENISWVIWNYMSEFIALDATES